jgi:mannose-6-phosphate isomerase-like protein (cupin superfamily)
MEHPKPFVRKLPSDADYHQILDGNNSIAIHSGRVVLLPGQECGKHSTENHEELVIVQSGAGEIVVEGIGSTKISTGMIAYNPPQTLHNVINTGSEPLSYIYVVTPVRQEG